jgi:hypothetical protein
LLREWRAREKILRRHRRDSGLTVSIEGGCSGTGYAIFIIRGIGNVIVCLDQIASVIPRCSLANAAVGKAAIKSVIFTQP